MSGVHQTVGLAGSNTAPDKLPESTDDGIAQLGERWDEIVKEIVDEIVDEMVVSLWSMEAPDSSPKPFDTRNWKEKKMLCGYIRELWGKAKARLLEHEQATELDDEELCQAKLYDLIKQSITETLTKLENLKDESSTQRIMETIARLEKSRLTNHGQALRDLKDLYCVCYKQRIRQTLACLKGLNYQSYKQCIEQPGTDLIKSVWEDISKNRSKGYVGLERKETRCSTSEA